MKKRVLYLLLALGILVLMSCEDAVTGAFLNNIPTEEHLDVFGAMAEQMQGVVGAIVEVVEEEEVEGDFDLTTIEDFTDVGVFATGNVGEDGIISFSLELVDYSDLLINGEMSAEISMYGESGSWIMSQSGEFQFDYFGDRTVGFNIIVVIVDFPSFIGTITVDGITYNAALFGIAFYDSEPSPE